MSTEDIVFLVIELIHVWIDCWLLKIELRKNKQKK